MLKWLRGSKRAVAPSSDENGVPSPDAPPKLWEPKPLSEAGAWEPAEHDRIGFRTWVKDCLSQRLYDDAYARVRMDLKEGRLIAGKERHRLLVLLQVAAHLANLSGARKSARQFADEMMEISLEGTGGSELDVAHAHVRLGDILRDDGQRTQAIEHYQAALTLRQRNLGDEHQHTAALRSYISSFDAAPQPKTAEQEEADKLAGDYQMTALLLENAGRLDEAEINWRHGLSTVIRSKGASHDDVAYFSLKLAELLEQRGRASQARRYRLHHLDIVGGAERQDTEEADRALTQVIENVSQIAPLGGDRSSDARLVEAVRSDEHLHAWVMDDVNRA